MYNYNMIDYCIITLTYFVFHIDRVEWVKKHKQEVKNMKHIYKCINGQRDGYMDNVHGACVLYCL